MMMPWLMPETVTGTLERQQARDQYGNFTGETNFSTEDALSFYRNGTQQTVENTEGLIKQYSDNFNYAQQQGLNTDASRYFGNVAMAAQLGDENTRQEN